MHIQSADYVPGVSGWKITKELIEINGGPLGPVRVGDLDQPEASPFKAQSKEGQSSAQGVAKPFILEGGVIYINQALVEDFMIGARITEEASARASADEALAGRTGALEAALADWNPSVQFAAPAVRFALTMARNSAGQYVATGIGLGIDHGGDDKQVGVDEALTMLCSKISETDLGRELQVKIDAVESVREMIRKELRPGGLLHRR